MNTYQFDDSDFATAAPRPVNGAPAPVLGAAAIVPQAAVDGLKNGPGAGVPPALAMTDPRPVNDMALLRGNTAILKNSPSVSSWANGDPAKVAATQDDFPSLAKIGNSVSAFAGQAWQDYLAPGEAAWKQLAIDAQRYSHAKASGLLDLIPGVSAKDHALGSMVMDAASIPTGALFSGPANVLARPIVKYGPQVYSTPDALKPSTWGQAPQPLNKQQAQQAVANTLLTASMGLGASGRLAEGAALGASPEGFAKPGTSGPPNTDHVHPVNDQGFVSDDEGAPVVHETQKAAAQWILNAYKENPNNPQIFEVANGDAEGTYHVKQSGLASPVEDIPAPGASQSVDSVRAYQADSDAEAVKTIEEQVASSQTHARLPSLIKDFVDENTQSGQVWISPEKLLEVYQGEGKVPSPDDSVFGHVPGFPEQFASALETGCDVNLSLGDYLAAASGKPWADTLRSGVRFREEGLSQDEAEVFGKQKDVEFNAPAKPEDITAEEHERALGVVASAKGAITDAVKSRYLNALFTDPKAAGMTKPQFDAYSAKVAGAVDVAHMKLLDRAYAQVRKERSPEWQEAFAQNKAAVEQEMFERSDIQALHYLKYGQHPNGAPLEGSLKLDKASTEISYSDTLTNRLPSGIFGKNGVGADDVAELFGYESGDSMLRDLARLEDASKAAGIASPKDYLKKLVNAQAHRATGEQLGFDLTPANIADAAQEAVTAPAIADLLSTELKALANQTGLSFDKATVAARAEEIFSQLPVKLALNIKEFERLIGRQGRQAEIALLKGDYVSAFRAKQQQLINHHLLDMAHKFAKDFPKTQAKFTRWARTPSSKNIAQDWMNQVHNELNKLGYGVRRDAAELEEQLGGETLGEFIDRKTEDGAVVAGQGDWPEKPLKEMNVGEYENVRDTLSSLIHNGRVDAGVVILGKRAAFNDVVGRVAENADALGRKLTPERLERLGLPSAVGRVARSLNAPMIRPEQLMDEVDRNDPLGPLNQAVIYPLQEAKGWENDELTRLTNELKAFAKTQPKEWLGSLNTKLSEAESSALRWTNPRTGLSELIFQTRGNMIRAMLNMGNTSNLNKLLEGYNWSREDLDSFLARNAMKADWDFVQHWWNAHESLWPRIASTYRNLSGVAPKRIVAQAVDTPYGKYEGGYFPITYDKLRAPEVKTLSSDSIWGEDYQSSLPANGYTKGRTGYVAPIALHFDGLNSSLGQIVHDLAFREALQQANRVLSNNDVRSAIQDNFGPSYTAQLRPWLEYTARERVFDDRAAAGITGIIRGLRTNLTFLGLGYRVSSVLIHADVALSDSIAEVGAKDFATAVGRLWQSPAQYKFWLDYVTANSPEIRNRLINMDSNIREAVMKLAEKQGFLSEVQHYGFHALGMSDNASAIPTWMAAVEQEIAKGRSPEEAFQVADKRVRQAHGSSAPVDLPAIQRGGHGAWGEAGRTAFGMFLSFMNHNYNRIWGIGRQYAKASDEAKAGDFAGATRDFTSAAARSFWYVIVPAITVSAIKNYEHEGSLVPKTLSAWIDGVAHASFGGYPGVGELISSLEKGDPGANPVQHALIDQAATIHNAFNESKKIAGKPHKNVSKRWLQQAVGTAGIYVQGVPGQAGTTGQFLWNFATGHEHPKDFNQFIRGVLFGPKPKGKK